MIHCAFDLPDSLFDAAREAADRDGTTLDQLFTIAIAEKLSALQTEELFSQRARRADFDRYREVLAKVPDVPPVPDDELVTDNAQH
jgi:hypothetical protein